ncbi:core-2/I-branching enzyme-domain-containing protein [Globomyces pollinis-pini]|nr:core-2/I-branching enzyme-domain-containing protein [Globomyces pollinis-pini]
MLTNLFRYLYRRRLKAFLVLLVLSLITFLYTKQSDAKLLSKQNQAYNNLNANENENKLQQAIGLDLKERLPGFLNQLEHNTFDDILPTNAERFFNKEQQDIFKYATEKRYITVTGFQFCDMLDGSSFDTLVNIKDLGGSIASVNPDTNEFINIIDSKAYDIFQALMRKFHLAHQRDVRRVSCYTAAEGQTVVANLTYHRLLHQVHHINYFKEVIPPIIPQPSIIPGPRKKYKLAYLIMVHEKNGFPQLSQLLEILDDGDAIILIHVDARTQSNALYLLLTKWIQERQLKFPDTSVYMAQNRFFNIWGHISLVFTQLSGFWELLDMADWDYVINLSNYDWPIKRNAQIHRLLSQDQYAGKNFIEYWPDTSDLAERFYRIHLGESDYSSVYHPSELGIVTWPNTNWRAYKHHQWVILTPESIRFLRNDPTAINFLSFAEHTYIPDESYFATVLCNSPEFNGKILNNNKRYLRFSGGAHPSWLGYPDRHLFPAYEPDPSFYFIRKMNTQGNIYEEKKLLKWIEDYHFKDLVPGACTIEQMSVRIECLKEFGDIIAVNNQLIIVPLNTPFSITTRNLICSLERLGIFNVLYWALDIPSYESLLTLNKPVIMLPGLNPMGDLQPGRTQQLVYMMRSKPKLIEMVLKAGFSTWFLDADIVALKDFRDITDPSADIFIGLDNTDHLIGLPPVPSSGIMYFKQSKQSLKFLELIQNEMILSSLLDDQDALRRVVKHKSVKALLPDMNVLYTTKQKRTDLMTETLLQPHTTTTFPESLLNVRYLDVFSFISGKVFIDSPNKIPKKFINYFLIHTHTPSNNQAILEGFGLWFVDMTGTCVVVPDPQPDFRKG